MEILTLLGQDESSTLDFKSEWYKIDSDNKKANQTQKGELIKDILALANGNSNVAGETAYLVIGADDEFCRNGKRELFDVQETDRITKDRILKIVNTACSPALEDLSCDFFIVERKNILVITIHPSPYIHETKVRVQTPKRFYDEYTVFVRHGDDVKTASTKERNGIADLKKLRFEERQNVHPILFGLSVGTIIGGLVFPPMTKKIYGGKEGYLAGWLVGPFIGGFFGGAIGSVFRDFREIRRNWHRVPLLMKIFGVLASVISPIAFWKLSNNLKKKNDS